MPKLLRPDSYEQAFAFGEVMVRLFYFAEWSWYESSEPTDLLWDTIDTQFGKLRDLTEELRCVLRPQYRPLCDELHQQADEAFEQYRVRWNSAEHREAITACADAVPEAQFEAAQFVLRNSPVMSHAWQKLKDLTVKFRDKLPQPLRDLATTNELLAKVFFRCSTDPEADDRNRMTERRFITVTLNRRLQTVLSSLRNHSPNLQNVVCNLGGLSERQACQRVQAFQRKVLQIIQQFLKSAENPSCLSDLHLKPCERQAHSAYEYALQKMSKSEGAARQSDRAVWNWLEENGHPDYQLPVFQSWSRYLRSARQKINQAQGLAEDGPTGRSIARYDEVHTSRLDRDK